MKKTKNAFTLIELLAVIVILAIIALIATPIILGIVEDARRDALVRSVELVVSTTNIDIASKTFTDEYIYTIEDGVVSNLEIGIKNTAGMNGKIIYNADGQETYAIHNGNYCIKKNEKMDKAEISEYNEEECTPTTAYKNGQRVYFDVVKGIGCTMEEYASSYDTTALDFQNSLTGYNGLNGSGTQNSCLLFYAFNDDGGLKVNLLLDHNTTSVNAWLSPQATPEYTGPIDVLKNLQDTTSSWNGTLTPNNYKVYQPGNLNGIVDYTILYKENNYKSRLIAAQEVAKITGADVKEGLMFDENTSTNSNWFYFDSLSKTESETCKSGNTTGCKYGWLYDRTSTTCEDYGCLNNADSGAVGNGYWTSTTAYNGGFTTVWEVINKNGLKTGSAKNDFSLGGTRPVIEVLKTKISPGVAPVIPQS